jgi:NAD(P)-dependent dehydrogenase (short-subunit alcohol dehydrogenase family)
MFDFTGKVVLVTGGSRGIGAETVRAVASAGGQAVIHYGSNDTAAKSLASKVGPDNTLCLRADLNAPEAASSLWRDTLAWRGTVDVLVNNAGVFLPENISGPAEDWMGVWQQTLQVNLISAAALCREAINTWRNAGTGGAIVNVASRASFRGDGPEYWSYAASKGGLISLTKTLARAYSAEGIYTYAVAPGYVNTDMAVEAFEHDPALRERVVSEIPIGDIAPPEEIANAICFLAAGLAKHATGQTIDLNGASYVR